MTTEKFKKSFRKGYNEEFLCCLLRMAGKVETVKNTVRLCLDLYKKRDKIKFTEEEEAEFLKEFDERIEELGSG